jgi:hypothetical protein
LISENGSTISGISAGSYVITVNDAVGCSTSATVIVNSVNEMVLVETVLNARCSAPNTGVISVQVSGGSAPYSYAWSNGASTSNISGLTPGSFCLTVTDALGCNQIGCYNISAQGSIEISIATVEATCGQSNGSATASSVQGQAPYTYVWSNGQTGNIITNLGTGIYYVTATDAFGCSAVQSFAVNNSGTPAVTVNTFNNNCASTNGGAIDITVIGGNAPFTYSWSNGSTSQDLSGLVNGTYLVIITDANGCSATAFATISNPESLVVEAEGANVACNNGNTGSIDVTVHSGATPYTYLWSNGVTTQDLSGLVAGNYGITVFDNNGCSVSTSVIITEPTAIVVAVESVTNATCNGALNGSVNISVVGGVLPYTFNWSNSATTEDLQNIGFGTYSVTVTDANGCTSSVITVNITQPEAIVVNVNAITDVKCNGGNDGVITITSAGGTAPYTYLWSNGATTSELTGVAAGTYGVTVTDVNGCTGFSS